jgi:hypothetical protein
MIIQSPFASRYGPGGQFLRVTHAWAPMGMYAAKRYSSSHEAGNPGFSLTTGLRGLGWADDCSSYGFANWAYGGDGVAGIYGQGTGIDGLGDLSGDGSGLFGSGLFGNSWGLPEFAIIGVVGYLLISGFGSGAQARRKELSKARLDYEAEVARIRDKYPRLPHPKSLF